MTRCRILWHRQKCLRVKRACEFVILRLVHSLSPSLGRLKGRNQVSHPSSLFFLSGDMTFYMDSVRKIIKKSRTQAAVYRRASFSVFTIKGYISSRLCAFSVPSSAPVSNALWYAESAMVQAAFERA